MGKRGRPCLNEDGPMSVAERKRRSRVIKFGSYNKLFEIGFTEKEWTRLQTIAFRRGMTEVDVIKDCLSKTKLPRLRK
jgi:hypothetical protein